MLFHPLRCALLAASILCLSASALAASNTFNTLPAEVEAALAAARIPRDAVAVLVVDAEQPRNAPRLSWRAQVPMNPASVMKLTTTFAALDLLGPAYAWTTPVYLDGPVHNGTLQGNVYIKGQGDPKLVLERLWLLLRRLQGLGIQRIAGDIVLDRSAFDLPPTDPASFDGDPLRPYNATPEALLVNYKAVVMTFTPDRASNTALVQYDPPLYGVQTQGSVPLAGGPCNDYRAALKADFSDVNRIRFAGGLAASCGEKVWPVAYADPNSYAPRAIQGLWLELGGKLTGNARWGTVPPSVMLAKPAFEVSSAPLAEIVRDINKYSNNLMAQQLFLTLGRMQASPMQANGGEADASLSAGSFVASRSVMQRWWKDRISTDEMPVWDNGSGLSRQERITAQGLAKLLQVAYRSPMMSELMSSLPITGVDGTLTRSKAQGSAHLKTGSLANVVARAGYVDAASGQRYVLVALINHPNASGDGARAVMDSLIDWAAKN